MVLATATGTWAIETDSDGCYLVGSVDDWKAFADIVLNTDATINGKMTADIDLGDDQTMIGSTSDCNTALHYKGIFDGQGHTLTVAYVVTDGNSLCAPFAKLDGATVRNIRVKGTMNSAGMHPACIASDARGTTVIESAWGDVIINSTRSGWVECASIVGCMKAGHCTIADCVFTGSITAKGSYNGCFVGYVDSGTAEINNCLSMGTFSGNFDFRGTHDNCFVQTFAKSIPSAMQCTETTLADGTVSTALQAGREVEVWVQDPLANQPMPKLFATAVYTVPESGVGTFSAKAPFVLPEGLTAHYCKTYDSEKSTISVEDIDGVVPASTGVLLKGAAGSTYTLTGTNATAATVIDNALVAVTEATHVEQTATEGDAEYTNFMLLGGKFVKIALAEEDTKMPANRAYLQIKTNELPSGDAGARSIAPWWGGDATGISPNPAVRGATTQGVYTLGGVRLGNLPTHPGLYIVGGKKVTVK